MTRKVWVTAALAAFIMMAMCSVAWTYPHPESMEITPSDQKFAPGGIANYTISITGILDTGNNKNHTIKAWVSGVSGSGTTDDLLFKFYHGTSSSGWLRNNETWEWWDQGQDSAMLNLSVKHNGSATDAVYQFKVEDGFYRGSIWDSAHATVYATAIPEFSTIAIPAAAIIGLLFFFNRRKRHSA